MQRAKLEFDGHSWKRPACLPQSDNALTPIWPSGVLNDCSPTEIGKMLLEVVANAIARGAMLAPVSSTALVYVGGADRRSLAISACKRRLRGLSIVLHLIQSVDVLCQTIEFSAPSSSPGVEKEGRWPRKGVETGSGVNTTNCIFVVLTPDPSSPIFALNAREL